jgi:hypothetical protein
MRWSLVAASLLIATPLCAQSADPGGRRRASLTVGSSFGDGETALALSAALGFQFSRRGGLEIEAAHARALDFALDLCPPPRVCIIGGRSPVTGRTVSLVPHLTIELTPTSGWMRVYLQAGAGVGHVRQRWWFPARGAGGVEFTRSSLVAAVSYGGGVAARAARRLEVGADGRWLHLFDDPPSPDRLITPAGNLTTIRIGSRVSWRF